MKLALNLCLTIFVLFICGDKSFSLTDSQIKSICKKYLDNKQIIKTIYIENKLIIIHCRSGKRSKVAANILLSQDYKGEILEIDEGIIGWIENNQPVISDL